MKRGGGVAVGEVHELEGNALLIGCYTEIGEDHVNKAGVAWAFGQAVVGKRGGGQGGVSSGRRRLGIIWRSFGECAIDLGHDAGFKASLDQCEVKGGGHNGLKYQDR